MTDTGAPAPSSTGWPAAVLDVFKAARIGHIGYVPDAGLATLIDLSIADPALATTKLTTEPEGIALAAGCWLGGLRSAVLMQSSGVGNCVNMLSLPVQSRSPLLMIVTMRGEWAEFNPWQVPMGRATPTVLEAMGIGVHRATTTEEIPTLVAHAAKMAFDSDQQVAVLIAQRLLGEKVW